MRTRLSLGDERDFLALEMKSGSTDQRVMPMIPHYCEEISV